MNVPRWHAVQRNDMNFVVMVANIWMYKRTCCAKKWYELCSNGSQHMNVQEDMMCKEMIQTL